MNRILTITVLLLSAAGCAAGQHYDYAAADMALPVTGSGEIGVAVIDVRPYVLNGEKKPDFVGLQRGGFGNPFDVTTQSGNPLAMDMQQVLIDALKDGGYHAQPIRITTAEDAVIARVIAAVGSPVNVLLFVREWKTDAMMKLGLTYDIELKVLGEQSDLLAQTQSHGVKEEIGGAGLQGQNSRTAADVFETKVSRMFNQPEVKKAIMEGSY